MRIYTSLVLGAGVLFTAVPFVHATLLAQEDFSGYTDGPIIGQGTATNGFSDAWRVSQSFGFFDENGFAVNAAPVVDPSIVSSGQSAGGGFTRIYRDLSPTVVADTATETTYISFTGGSFFLSQFELAFGSDNDADHVAEFATSDTPGSPAAAGTGNQGIGSQINVMNTSEPYSSGEDITPVLGEASGEYPIQTPDLYVIKFDPIDRTVGYYMFANGVAPTSLADATSSLTYAIDPTRAAEYDRIGLFTVESPSTTGISNIRIGTAFSDVAPLAPVVPEPATLSILALGSLGLIQRRRRD
jgi:hypothetical protein